MLEPATSMVMRKHGNTALASGQSDMAFHGGLDPSTGSNVIWSQYPLGRKDDMEVSRMTKEWSQLRLGFDPTGIISVEPTYLFTNYVAGTIVYPTMLAFASMLFTYWRGIIDYKFVFHSSPLVRWRVAIVVVPPGSTVPATYAGAGDYLTTVVDVVGSTEVEIQVPYLYPTPWRAISQKLTGGATTARIVFFQLCLPTGPGSSTAQPLVDVWVRGGADFELAYPTLDYVNQFDEAQGGVGVEGSRALFNFGEEVNSWRLLVKRPATDLVLVASDAAGSAQSIRLPMDGMGNTSSATIGFAGTFAVTRSGWSYATFLRRAFFGYNGGSVHRLIVADEFENFAMHVRQELEVPGSSLDVPAPRMLLGVGGGDVVFTRDDFIVEVAFPSRANANFKNAQKLVVAASPVPEEVVAFSLIDVSSGTTNFQHLYSAMDDFSMGGLVFIPPLVVRV